MSKNQKKISLRIENLNKLKKVATFLSKNTIKNFFIGLSGNLGAGKTQFVKLFYEALGGNPDDIVSPTFTLLNEYKINNKMIYHFDLYRLTDLEELEEIGYKDFFYSENAIIFVEWIENIPDSLPKKYMIIKIIISNNNERILHFECRGTEYENIMQKLNKFILEDIKD